MAKYNVGDKVLRVDNGMRGTVVVVKESRGRVLYSVAFDGSGTSNVLEADLRKDFNLSDPFERCKSGVFASYSDYAKINTTFKIKNSNNSTISSLKSSRTLFRAYQFKPLMKFLNSPNRRLLVADEVGLGKTIEAGHIMLELKARGELKNVVIVCPKPLREKWQVELHEKFGLNFKIIESVKDLIADLKSNSGYVRVIVNYEKIRQSRAKVIDIQESYSKDEEADGGFIDFLEQNSHRFSLVLCDEAHKMRNSGTQVYKGADVLMDLADSVLFLTATPVMISDENLFNLLRLLDKKRFFSYDIFHNRMNENRPFVNALSLIGTNTPINKVFDKLAESDVVSSFHSNDQEIFRSNSTIGEIYEDDPIFKEIRSLCQGGEDTPKVRARLQYLFSSMSMMNTVFSRTRKREVTTDLSQAERKPHPIKVTLTHDEQECFDEVINNYVGDNSYTDIYGEERLGQGRALGLVSRKRQVASSVWGYYNDISDLEQGIDRYADYEDSKVNKLKEIIDSEFKTGPHKLIVFAVYRNTLLYLAIRLRKAGYNVALIYGKVDNRDEILQTFKNDDSVQILLSSEVGSEGLDMQFCSSMVNYDLPWNPMVVEQRIGRIDRFGQKSSVVHIYNFIVEGSIQEDIYMRLLDRIGIFRSTVGDMEAILDAEIRVDGEIKTIHDVYKCIEQDVYTKKLMQSEIQRKLAEVEQAIANEKHTIQILQDELSNALTNDAYFKDEINRILYNNAYVTKEELENYVQSVIRQELTTCDMEEKMKDVWEFRIPASRKSVLRDFLSRYCDMEDETAISLNAFRRQVDDKMRFPITFSQDVAYEDRTVSFLNIYHPMIQACRNYFLQNADSSNTTFSFALHADDVLKRGDRYYMGVYELKSERMLHGKNKVSAELLPVFFNVQTGKVEENEEVAERLFRRSQVEGKEHNASNKDYEAGIIDDMSFEFAGFVSDEMRRRLDEKKMQDESDRIRNEKQTIDLYNSRMNIHEKNIQEAERSIADPLADDKERQKNKKRINLAKNLINMLERELSDKLAVINADKHFVMNEKLLSLSLITII